MARIKLEFGNMNGQVLAGLLETPRQGIPISRYAHRLDREAAKIYQAARHPKSFISLDQADHLSSNREDAEYVAEPLVSWASRYLKISAHEFERSYGTAPEVRDRRCS
jgi:hypothetical protein